MPGPCKCAFPGLPSIGTLLTFAEFYLFPCLSRPPDQGLLKDSDCVFLPRGLCPAQRGTAGASVCQECQHPCLLETGCSLLFLQNKGTRHPDGGQRVFGGPWGRQAGLQERLPPRVSWAAPSLSCVLLF